MLYIESLGLPPSANAFEMTGFFDINGMNGTHQAWVKRSDDVIHFNGIILVLNFRAYREGHVARRPLAGIRSPTRVAQVARHDRHLRQGLRCSPGALVR